MNNLGVALRHRRRHLLALALFSESIRSDPMDAIPRANLNRVLMNVAGVSIPVLVWVGVLAGLLAAGATSGTATRIAVALLIPCVVALAVLVVTIPRWYRRLPLSSRRVLRDRESWGATFGNPSMDRRRIARRMVRHATLPIYVTLGCVFIILPVLHWTGAHGAASVAPHQQRLDWPGQLFGTGLAFAAAVLVQALLLRLARRRGIGAPQRVDPVAVDWP